MSQEGLSQVWQRNLYYQANSRILNAIVLLLFTSLLLLLGFLYYRLQTPIPPRYFATYPNGAPIKVISLDNSLYKAEEVATWTLKAIQDIYSFDFVTYLPALQEAGSYFSESGHKNFLMAMRDSNNLKAVKEKKFILSVESRGNAEVEQQGPLASGIYAWQIKLPLSINFENSAGEQIKQKVVAKVVVIRASFLRYQQGLAIDNIVLSEI